MRQAWRWRSDMAGISDGQSSLREVIIYSLIFCGQIARRARWCNTVMRSADRDGIDKIWTKGRFYILIAPQEAQSDCGSVGLCLFFVRRGRIMRLSAERQELGEQEVENDDFIFESAKRTDSSQ